MKSLFRFDQKAFTLLELLVVIAIIGMITAASVVPYTNFVKKSRDARRKVDLEQMRAALELYKSNNTEGVYPEAASLETALVPNYIKNMPEDPQGGEYDYACVNACKDYTLKANLESGQIYVTDSGGGSVYSPTRAPSLEPTVTTQLTSIPTNTTIPSPTNQLTACSSCGYSDSLAFSACTQVTCIGNDSCQIQTVTCGNNTNCKRAVCVDSSAL